MRHSLGRLSALAAFAGALRRLWPASAALAFAATLAACAPPVEQRQHLLEAPAAAASPAGAALPAVGLRELALPLYARRPQMATLGADGAISSSDDHRWAEDTPRAATRLVARWLQARGGGEVYIEPWPQGFAPALIVNVEVDKMIGALGGTVDLTGEIIVARRTARDRPASVPFTISVAAEGEDHGALARAYGAALAMLADRIAEAAGGV